MLFLALKPELLEYMMGRITEVHEENLRRVLESSSDLIDIVYFFDDVASQNSLLMSPAMYTGTIQPYHQRIIDLAARYDKPVMMHCCGSVYPLIDRFIDMGLSILNPVQPSARNMNPEKLAADFGERISFHGGIDVQQFLPFATPEQVREKVGHTCGVLGRQGGYIMSGSHHFQPDIPLENILAMYGVSAD
jgi:uroporphyrinogen decarboxylase